MTFDEFVTKVLAVFPNASVGEDNEGQLIVYTNWQTVASLTGEATSDVVEMIEVIED